MRSCVNAESCFANATRPHKMHSQAGQLCLVSAVESSSSERLGWATESLEARLARAALRLCCLNQSRARARVGCGVASGARSREHEARAKRISNGRQLAGRRACASRRRRVRTTSEKKKKKKTKNGATSCSSSAVRVAPHNWLAAHWRRLATPPELRAQESNSVIAPIIARKRNTNRLKVI